MTEETRQAGEIGRRDFIDGVNASVLALHSGALTFGLGSLASAQPNGTYAVREIENVWIPMSDGTQLAARLWLPEDAEENPVPVLLSYYPYRKRDGTRLNDESLFPYFARNGYAGIRVDIRGSGDSEGLPQDEYVKQEQDDALEIFAWLERQPWCNGRAGMFGLSWGGFNTLQVAARRPPALKAVITHCSTDDRYTDDAHFKGGAVIQDMFNWGGIFFHIGAHPPDPEIVGDRWLEMWMDRLRNMDFNIINWLRHQHRDDFWKHASVIENYGDIECPVYAIGGWVDCYSNAIPRLLAGLQVPSKGLIGPWGHMYPHSERAQPGPRIDYLNEALRWWDYWLKDIDTGIMEEPALRVWMQDEAACCGMNSVNGRWISVEDWPSERIVSQTWYLNASGLETSEGDEEALHLTPHQTVGQTAPRWCPFNMETDLPVDQAIDDALSLTFDSEPLEESFEIVGAPIVTVDVAVDKPVALLAVRLNEVLPDRSSRRVTYSVLNLTHRDSHETPTALVPGQRYRIALQLDDIAHVFKVGSRLRIAVSTAYWPHTWPSPEPVNLTLFAGTSIVEFPIRPPRAADSEVRFGEAFEPENSGMTMLDPGGEPSVEYVRDVGGSVLTMRQESPESRRRLDAIGTELSSASRTEMVIDDNDPSSATLEMWNKSGYRRDTWDARIESTVRFSVTEDEFVIWGEYLAYDHDELISDRTWDERIPRQLV